VGTLSQPRGEIPEGDFAANPLIRDELRIQGQLGFTAEPTEDQSGTNRETTWRISGKSDNSH
jgi:hypothetical protein